MNLLLEAALVEWVSRAAEAILERSPAARPVSSRGAAKMVSAGPGRRRDVGLADTIARDLVDEALRSGLLLAHHERITDEPLSGGNTAERVGRLALQLPFVFKMDSQTPKLAAEGAAIRAIRADPRLPAAFREAWPIVYALRSEAPFAYLMEYFPKEDGWVSLEDRLYPKLDASSEPVGRNDGVELTIRVLDVLFSGYEASRDPRSMPNVFADYVDRIAGRLAEAAEVDTRFRPCRLRIGDREFEPWSVSLERIRSRPDRILAVTPGFRTVVHGDPNPGNLLLKTSIGGIELKLIDPKEWGAGDYLFDIAKITHFLSATGPVEKPLSGRPCVPRVGPTADGLTVDYEIDRPPWTDDVIARCLARTEAFAMAHGDRGWRARYALAMASNLLGLPIGRLTHARNPRPAAAMVLYCEGLKWLDEACSLLGLRGEAVAS